MYEAKLKFVELGENFRLPTRGTRAYKDLKEQIARALTETQLSSVPGFEEVVIKKFKTSSLNFGELEAEMLVVVDKEAYETEGGDVKESLKSIADSGKVGSHQVEPQSLIVKEPGK